MTGPAARPRATDRAGLAALCLLLVLSVAVRVQAYRTDGQAPATEAEVIDLGDGLHLSRASALRRSIWVGACSRPAVADFVEASPHGRDASLTAADDPGDRVAYLYRGRVLEGHRAAMTLSLLHFIRRAGAVIKVGEPAARDELAVKLTVPANCEAPFDEVVSALRQDVRFWP